MKGGVHDLTALERWGLTQEGMQWGHPGGLGTGTENSDADGARQGRLADGQSGLLHPQTVVPTDHVSTRDKLPLLMLCAHTKVTTVTLRKRRSKEAQ